MAPEARSRCSWCSKSWRVMLSSLEFCLKTHKALEMCSHAAFLGEVLYQNKRLSPEKQGI